jgi:hypothetical protein
MIERLGFFGELTYIKASAPESADITIGVKGFEENLYLGIMG